MYSIAAIISGKDSEDLVTIHRTAVSAEIMTRILNALLVLGAVNISVVKK